MWPHSSFQILIAHKSSVTFRWESQSVIEQRTCAYLLDFIVMSHICKLSGIKWCLDHLTLCVCVLLSIRHRKELCTGAWKSLESSFHFLWQHCFFVCFFFRLKWFCFSNTSPKDMSLNAFIHRPSNTLHT